MNLIHPITGEEMTIEQPAGAGEVASRIRFTLPPFQDGPPLHYHRWFEETFEVIEGELEIEVGDRPVLRRLRAGERVTVPAGTRHAFRNASPSPVTFRTVVERGAGFERFLRGWYGAAIDGRSGKDGAPRHLLELVTLLDEGDVCLANVPLFVQLGLRSVLTRIAAWAGVRARLARWW